MGSCRWTGARTLWLGFSSSRGTLRGLAVHQMIHIYPDRHTLFRVFDAKWTDGSWLRWECSGADQARGAAVSAGCRVSAAFSVKTRQATTAVSAIRASARPTGGL